MAAGAAAMRSAPALGLRLALLVYPMHGQMHGQGVGLGGAPSPNTLLQDLRTMQFPNAPAGQQPGAFPGQAQFGFGQQGGQAMPGMAAPMAPGGLGGAFGAQTQPSPGGGAFGSGGGLPGGGFGGFGGFGAPAAPQAPPPQPQGFGGFGGGNLGGNPGMLQGGLNAGPAFGQGPASPMGGGLGGFGQGQGMPPPGTYSAPGLQQAPGEERTLEDLACTVGMHSAVWSATKRQFRQIFQDTLPWQPVAREALSATMESGLQILMSAGAMAPQAPDECGLGKLTLQLFSFSAVDEPQVLLQLFAALEQLASPVLTMLLDMPFAGLAQTGWPIVALLAQINLRKQQIGAVNDERVDGVDDMAGRQFQAELLAALAARDGAAAQDAATRYLSANPQGQSALAPLTALATQAMASPDAQERMQLLEVLQQALKQVIGSGAELDLALSTKWPLWGVLHVALDAFAV
ncbi:hypothetical protein AK812_SmicGene26891 [Symbiodinium microadriaticum]|uniref:Uncharacterized protein n=1 Tax=Symbiodinium microadriaticum TaxID=2951 RepID=A0A1Q9D8H7_SYMMI|nr:hypothetical protein AK812_SmicGene26891 [Symbiodinium microadriaticum]CAE7233566.1 unnamed protein product [Symbiodinium sp. KB8]CAE7528984.1 unnamed protein product [Symbiodinium microadriaticum]